MTIARLCSFFIPRTSYLKRLRQFWQRHTHTMPPQKPSPANQIDLYTLAIAIAEQYGLD